MRVFPAKTVWLQGFSALLLSAVVLLFFLLPVEAGWLSVVPAVSCGLLYFWIVTKKHFRRRRAVAEPFPDSWRNQLANSVALYDKLDDDGKQRFEQDVQIFLSEQRIYGVRGAEVDDEVKVLVAASAATLGSGRPGLEWPNVRDVIIYPTAFNEDYGIDEKERIAGMVHHQGPIIFSAPSLTFGFARKQDGLNTGLHELAHVLDFAGGQADGVPAGARWVASAPWISIVADRLEKVRRRRGRKGRLLRAYAGTNEAELFAVAVEVFFERPEALAEGDLELFDMLAEYFNIDPRTGKTLT